MRPSRQQDYVLLLALTCFAIAIKAYDPIRSPVLGALDPWGWVETTREFLATGSLGPLFTDIGYPPTFMYLLASITTVGVDVYEVVRYIPIASALVAIPIYLLVLEIFRSRAVAVSAVVLTITTRYQFMRTSVGIPEGLSHFFVVFTLFFLLRSLKTGSWTYRALGVLFMTTAILYYHFTLIILIPFLAVLLFTAKANERGASAKTLASIVIPSILASGLIWHFRVAPQIIAFYFGTKVQTYEAPVFDHSVAGLLQALAFSIAKMGATGLSDLGYLMAALGMAGLTALFVLRPGNRRRLETRFFITYLITLAVLAVSLRTAYNLGFSGAGDSSVYMLSWLAMPVAGFASYATVMALRAVTGRALSIPAAQFSGSQAKVLLAVIILLLCVVNLSAVNYYKAWDGKGIGVLSSHYYYKCLTDQEYYALRYVHDNTPLNATVLVVGLDGTILTYHSVVSERPTISIQEMRTSGETIIAEVLMRYPDPTRPYSNSSGVKISFDMSSREDIYLMTGITRTSLALARQGGSPPASIKQMENVLLSALLKCPGCEYVYHNEQVLVVRVPCALIELPNSPTDTS